jgi:hypothetical protein
MKTIDQVQDEIGFGNVYTSEDFAEDVEYGGFTPYDGIGYYHDGEEETHISVWSDLRLLHKYPYVCWYNK